LLLLSIITVWFGLYSQNIFNILFIYNSNGFYW
jgi:hypothetical protein